MHVPRDPAHARIESTSILGNPEDCIWADLGSVKRVLPPAWLAAAVVATRL